MRFARELITSPLEVGAVAPSSAALANAMTEGLSAADGPVIELGPGTGVFTRALLARGIPQEQIAAIEASQVFASTLTARHEGIAVIHGDAARVRRLSPFGPATAGIVICGLPLLSISRTKILRIVAESFACLRDGGVFRLFTYGPRCPVPGAILQRLDIVARRSSFVHKNIPPASVYVLQKRRSLAVSNKA